jgi:adenylosuccinate synthase
MVDVILGLQWGDEGKGKIVDFFAKNYGMVARFQGGANAGHTLYVNDKKIVLHQIPSGIFHDGIVNLIGNGVVLDLVTLKKECEKVAEYGVDVTKNLFISHKAHLILPTHKALDKANEASKGNDKIGSTLKGIGPAYMDKTGRNGLRAGDILDKTFTSQYIKLRLKHQRLLDSLGFTEDISAWEEEFFEALDFARSLKIINSEYYINDFINSGKAVLAEGAQGSMLDVDFGTFPFVTSSSTTSGGVCSGLGISPKKINEIIGVSKAYCTRVGSGPFPTELLDETGEKLRTLGSEFGATTGRPRRCGWIDLVALNYACSINGVTKLVITKADILDGFSNLNMATAYEINGEKTNQIPYNINKAVIQPVYEQFVGWSQPLAAAKSKADFSAEAITYFNYLQKAVNVPISHVSNGPGKLEIVPF